MALCIRDMAKAAGAYAKFENPDHFRAVTENGTRPGLLSFDDEAGGGVPRYPRSGHQHLLAPEDLRYSAQDYG